MAYTTIDKPSEHFKAMTYTGNASSSRDVTGVGFQPDFTWIKDVTGGFSHILGNVVSGDNKFVSSNNAAGESTDSTKFRTFVSDGFQVGNHNGTNANSNVYVSWNWKGANGTASNTDGDVTSTVSANPTAGFSVLTATSTATSGNTAIGHGLGKTPDVVFARNTVQAFNWDVWFRTSGYTATLQLNDANASARTGFGSGTNDSNVFSALYNYSAYNNEKYVYYCFTSIKGFSKISQYTGNGDNGNGPFIYTGFKPAMVMIKRSDTVGNYVMFDNARSPFNTADNAVSADLSDREYTSADGVVGIDMLSNGFKCKDNHTTRNASGGVYQYLAFAENPFVTSTGIPATAR